MWKITTVIFLITTIICAYKWITIKIASKIAIEILADYGRKKGYTRPTKEELAGCTENVQNHILKRLRKMTEAR